jgi:serine/threonine-protein kinase
MTDEPRETATAQRVNEILAVYLEAERAGSAPDRAELLARHPDLAAELRSFFADRDRFGQLVAPLGLTALEDTARTVPPSDGSNPAPPPGPRLRYVGDYELLEEVARGGMGVVYKARQISLHRTIALKMILAGQLASAADVQRFKTEAEAVANLDHPHVLPIYEVGEHDGQPYFSMKLVEGGSLAQRAAGFRADPRAAARLVATVARAVQHAHERGVLHRDLKPANILLDADGQPHVTDFGLAKRVAGPGREPGEALTQSGAIVGTPGYMAPEQAAGKKGLTTAADIYGLGAVLYELLTGRPPFQADTPLNTVLQVLEREPERPATLNPRVPRDLETICLKCLHKEPARRYATAEALAADLEHWLCGEPIVARPAGSAERLWRWCRRKPLVAGLAASLVLVFVGGFAGVTVLWLHAERQTLLAQQQQARAEEKEKEARQERERVQGLKDAEAEQRRQAEQGFQQARAAVDRYLDKVTGDPRLRDARFRQLRRDLLLEASHFYWQFIKDRAGDPNVHADLGWAHFKLAVIATELGDPAGAAADYARAAEEFEYLSHWAETFRQQSTAKHEFNAGPFSFSFTTSRSINRETEFQDAIARTYNNLGSLHYDERKYDLAEKEFLRALAIQEELARQHPDEPTYQYDVADLHGNLGNVYAASGQFDKARLACEKAFEVHRQLARRYPDNGDYQLHLAGSYSQMSRFQWRDGKPDQAEKSLQQAVAICRELVRKQPAVLHYQQELGFAYHFLGDFYRSVGKNAEAEAALRQAVEVQRRLTESPEAVPNYSEYLANSHERLAGLYESWNKPAEAAAAYQEALAIRSRLADQYPNNAGYRHALGNSLNSLGIFYWATGKQAEAEAAYQRALDVRARLVKDFPQAPAYATELGGVQCNLALLLAPARPDEALSWFDQAAGTLTAVLERKLPPEGVRDYLRKTYEGRAALQASRQRYPEALTDWQGALELDKSPEYASPVARLARAQVLLADELRTHQQPKESLPWYGKALAGWQELRRQDAKDLAVRQGLGDAHAGRARALTLLQRYADALPDWERAVELADGKEKGEYTAMLGGVRAFRADELAKAGKTEEALALYGRAIAVLTPLRDDGPDGDSGRASLHLARLQRAQLFLRLKRYDEALQDWEQLVVAEKNEAERPRWLLMHALTRAEKGEHAAAAAAVERLVADRSLPGPFVVAGAAVLASAAGAAGKDPALSPDARARLTRRYADRAVELLTRGRTADFFRDPTSRKLLLDKDSFEAVQSHPDFQKLRQEVEAEPAPDEKGKPK